MKTIALTALALTMTLSAQAGEMILRQKAVCRDSRGQQVGVSVVHTKYPNGLSIVATLFGEDALGDFEDGMRIEQLQSTTGPADYNPSQFDAIDVMIDGEKVELDRCESVSPFRNRAWNKLLTQAQE